MQQRQARGMGVKYMLAGGSAVAAVLGLVSDPRALLPKSAAIKDTCEAIVQEKAVLSRQQLSQFLDLPERSPKAQVAAVMKAPYCRLSDAKMRSGATAHRDAYPLAFDPQTWFVVLYEGDEYAGYSFSFRHQ